MDATAALAPHTKRELCSQIEGVFASYDALRRDNEALRLEIEALKGQIKDTKEGYLQSEGAAKYLGVTAGTIKKYVSLGMPHFKPPSVNKLFFKREQIDAWLMKRGRS